jgi:hypothetical protein
MGRMRVCTSHLFQFPSNLFLAIFQTPLPLPSSEVHSADDVKRYPSRIHALIPPYEKQRIREQHSARTGPSKTALSIFMTNAMECGNGAAVFEVAARFNHCCVPNAFFSWNGTKHEERIYAVKDVDVGEVSSEYFLWFVFLFRFCGCGEGGLDMEYSVSKIERESRRG